MHILPSTIAFRLEYMLFYQFYTEITFFDQEKFCTAPLLYVDIEMFGANLHENNAKTSKSTSNSSYWPHAWESSYTPRVRWHFRALVGFMEILVRYARIDVCTYGELLTLYTPTSLGLLLSLFVCVLLVHVFFFALFRIAWWPSTGKELFIWLSACVLLYLMLSLVSVPVLFDVLGRMWKWIVPVPDHCLFISLQGHTKLPILSAELLNLKCFLSIKIVFRKAGLIIKPLWNHQLHKQLVGCVEA